MDYDDFTDDQKKVIEHGKGALLVEAGPGSGKTTVIVERIKHIIKMKKERKEEVDPESFLVITFTNKAADSLKHKLRRDEEIPNDFVSKMQISTIHSFCFDYLKNVCKNKDKYSTLTLIDDDASEKKSLFIQNHKKWLGFNKEYTIFNYQIPIVMKKFGEYTSFKVDTDSLIEKIQDSRKISPAFIKFANSRKYFSVKNLEDYDNKIQDLKKNNPDELTDEEMECEGIKRSWYNAIFLQIARAYPKYLELLEDKNYVDYDYLQRKALDELKEDPEPSYKVVFVDEFQDTDPLQYRIFKTLNKTCDYFTAVGDVDQHIYAFRSSFNDFFDEFKTLEEHTPLPLNDNFRSTENIVQLTEEFIKPQREGKPQRGGKKSDKNMRHRRTDCNNCNFLIENSISKEDEEDIKILNEAEKPKEAKYIKAAENIYKIIKFLMENNKIKDYSDVAILYRKHKDKTISYLIEKFNENGIDFSVKGRKDLSEQNEVQTILTLMWYITRKTHIGYVPSEKELQKLNLKALCGDYFETSFLSLDDSTKDYLCKLQDSYYIKVTKKEYDLLNKEHLLSDKDDEFLIKKASNLKGRKASTQDFLDDLFRDLQMPIIEFDKIINPIDKEFFKQLENIRNEIKPIDSQTIESSESKGETEEPLTILDVFYKLIALSNLYDYEFAYKEIANLAILTQTISNYESFISEIDFKGAYYFLKGAIENYDSYQKEGSGVQLMTIHSAKGLEFPVTIITSLEENQFPPEVKDPRENNRIDTYHTPNECLKYKTIINEDEDCEVLSIEEEMRRDKEEEDRVLYVAMTRAEDLLILSSTGEVPQQIKDIRNHPTVTNKLDKLSEVEIPSAFKELKKGKDMDDEMESLEEPIVLNYSKYTQYLSCPYKYDLSYNLGFRRSGSAKAANRGSAFHNIMEELNKRLIKGETVSKEELEDITTEFYESMFDIKENQKDFDEFKQNVENYYFKYSVNREVLHAEYDFELYVDNNLLEDRHIENAPIDFILNGAIDLIYKVSDDEYVILDYKYAEYDENHIDAYKKQAYIYALALSQHPDFKDKIKKAIIHFVLSDKEYPVDINEECVNEELKSICKVAEEIYDVDEAFDKKPEKANECVKCSYRYFCKPKDYAHELYD